jgi:hypothetical protein
MTAMQSVGAKASYQATSRHVSFPATSVGRFFPKRYLAGTVKLRLTIIAD